MKSDFCFCSRSVRLTCSLGIAILLATSTAACQEADDQESIHDPELAQQLHRASAVALVEITKLTKQDDRPSDGDHWLKVEFRAIKSSGELPEHLYLVIESGGLSPLPIREEPQLLMTPDDFEVGEQHWFVFGGDHDASKYPYWVMNWWPVAGEEVVPAQVVDALEEDKFDWHPVFDPQTKIVFGYTVDSAEDKWKVRVERDGMRLWELQLDGRPMVEANFLFAYPSLLPDMKPIEGDFPTTSVLNVESIRTIPDDNRFGEEAGEYRMREAFDLANGELIGAWVMRPQVSSVIESYFQFDVASGQPVLERRNLFVTQFAEDVGADSNPWYFRVEKEIDPESGEVLSYSFFRYGQLIDEAGNALGNGFVPISNETIERIGLERVLDARRK